MKHILTFFLFLFLAPAVHAQLNCNKFPLRLTDNVTNPSFEQVPGSCIGLFYLTNGVDLHPFVPGWKIAASYNGAWYLGECADFLLIPPFPVFPKVPLPIPDGKGVLAFLDRSGNGFPVSKSYVSSCLAKPLLKDYPYQLTVSVGFGVQEHRFDTMAEYKSYNLRRTTGPSPETITLFGHADCNAVPTNAPTNGFADCLSKANAGWIELGTIKLTADSGTWAQAAFNFIPPYNINVIALGPACDSKLPNQANESTFYFLDNLRLYNSPVPKPAISVIAGSLCDGPLASATLQMQYATIYQGSKFQWYKNNNAINEINSTLTVAKTNYGKGWYQCSVENDSVCMRSDSLYIDWAATPSPTALGNPDTTACNGDIIALDVTTPGATYLWDDGSTVASRNISQPGSYSVTVSNTCGTLTLKKHVDFKECPAGFFMPSGFTPNHDGLNDVLKAHARGPVRQFLFSIFNRSGQRIFTTTDINKGWDGSFRRTPLDQGTFVWMINYLDGNGISRTDKGTVVLIR